METAVHAVRPEQKQLYEDFKTAVQVMEAPFNEPAVTNAFNTYHQFFISEPTTSSVMYRITTKIRRDISLRYMDFSIPHDPLVMAVENGLITREGHPIEELYLQLQEQVNMLGYGVDFTASQGFEKIWPFYHPFSIDDLLALPAMPQAARDVAGYCRKFDLYWTSLLALDFRAKTMNFYFMQKTPGRYSTEQIAEMFTDLGFERPSDQVLELGTKTFTIYPTFSWDTLEPLRLSFAVHATDPRDVPSLHPLIDNFVAEAPVNTADKGYTFGPAYGKGIAPYFKLENDYCGKLVPVIGQLIETLN